MHQLTRTQKRILQLLPATPGELAQTLYGRATASERNLVYVHVALLRRRLSARCPTGTPQAELNGTARITSRPLSAAGKRHPSYTTGNPLTTATPAASSTN